MQIFPLLSSVLLHQEFISFASYGNSQEIDMETQISKIVPIDYIVVQVYSQRQKYRIIDTQISFRVQLRNIALVIIRPESGFWNSILDAGIKLP